MRYEQNVRMPRTIDHDRDYAPFPLCTPVGGLGQVSDDAVAPNAFDKELGTGITIYFKLLRYLAFVFLLFTLLSVPTYWICLAHGPTRDPLNPGRTAGLGNILSSFSVGNVGEATLHCTTVAADKSTVGVGARSNSLPPTYENVKAEWITCPFGQIQGFTEVGLIDTTCAARGRAKAAPNRGHVQDACNLALFDKRLQAARLRRKAGGAELASAPNFSSEAEPLREQAAGFDPADDKHSKAHASVERLLALGNEGPKEGRAPTAKGCLGLRRCRLPAAALTGLAQLAAGEVDPVHPAGRCVRSAGTKLRIVAYCQDDVLGEAPEPLAKGAGGVTRDQLAIVVAVFDVLVCLFWIFFVEWALYLIAKEERVMKKTSVLITDFAVRIGGLPERSVFGTHSALEAKLVNHINKIVTHEAQEQYYSNMPAEEREKQVPVNEVASIHFGDRSF